MSLNANSADVAFTFKGGMLPMTVMELTSANPERIRRQLAGKLSQLPLSFSIHPLCLAGNSMSPTLVRADLRGMPRPQAVTRPYVVVLSRFANRHGRWGLAVAPVEEGRARALETVAPLNEPEDDDIKPATAVSVTIALPGDSAFRPAVSAAGSDLIVIGAVNAGADARRWQYSCLWCPARRAGGYSWQYPGGHLLPRTGSRAFIVAGNYKRLEDIDSQLLGRAAEVHFIKEQLEIKPLE